MTSRHQAIGLAVSIAICFGAAGIGFLLTTPSINGWYATLMKPLYTPPNWIFGPVWSALYFSMAIAAWLVWRRAGFSGARTALALFAAQLVLNVCWSAIFFWAHRPGWAFAEIILLWVLILATIIAFSSLSRAAAWLMVPYLLWVAFAVILNYSIWRLSLTVLESLMGLTIAAIRYESLFLPRTTKEELRFGTKTAKDPLNLPVG